MRILSIAFFVLAGLIAWVFIPTKAPDFEKIKGVCLVNPPEPIESTVLSEVKRVHAEWVAVIPYAFSRPGESSVRFDHFRQWWGERTEGNCMLMRYAKEHHLKVMVKPHIWCQGQGWMGDFDLETEEEWKAWEQEYARYILHHATKADSMGAELFCIGTEIRIPARERPDFWRGLIKDVRDRYSGQITYAANWDNYEYITWWDEVDYIGVDAYFPLVEGDHPSIEEIEKGWEPVKAKLASFSKQWSKPILFTEYGFQSINGATGRHWEVAPTAENANPQLQADAFEATFSALEKEKWFAGGFFWKWHLVSREGEWHDTEWTPQNKPAEKVIAKWYGKKGLSSK